MKNRKALLALALVLILGTTLVAGGTLAWFSDTDEVTNTFTVGSVEIVQNETDAYGNPFVQDQQLIPVGSNDTPTDDANFITKQVTVTNTGKNPAYVQTFIAVPKALDMGLLKWDCNLTVGGWEAVDGDAVAAGIQPVGTMTYDMDNDPVTAEDTLNVYCYRYAVALAKAGETGDKSPILLNGVYIDQAADMDVIRDAADVITEAYFLWDVDNDGAVDDKVDGYDLAKIEKLPVLVATQAVQAQGFTSASEALGSAFPNHPWYVAP